jgi:hypothetical protein
MHCPKKGLTMDVAAYDGYSMFDVAVGKREEEDLRAKEVCESLPIQFAVLICHPVALR